MDYEIVKAFITTDEEDVIEEATTMIVAFFLVLFDSEVERFSKKNSIVIDTNSTSYYEKRMEYALQIEELLLGMRERYRNKLIEWENNQELTSVDIKWKMYDFIRNSFLAIEVTETSILLQTAQLYVISQYLKQHPTASLWKRWIARSDSKVCDICKALNGTEVPVEENLLNYGQEIELHDGSSHIYDYIDRQVACAHPHCRCDIEFFIKR